MYRPCHDFLLRIRTLPRQEMHPIQSHWIRGRRWKSSSLDIIPTLVDVASHASHASHTSHRVAAHRWPVWGNALSRRSIIYDATNHTSCVVQKWKWGTRNISNCLRTQSPPATPKSGSWQPKFTGNNALQQLCLMPKSFVKNCTQAQPSPNKPKSFAAQDHKSCRFQSHELTRSPSMLLQFKSAEFAARLWKCKSWKLATHLAKSCILFAWCDLDMWITVIVRSQNSCFLVSPFLSAYKDCPWNLIFLCTMAHLSCSMSVRRAVGTWRSEL